MVKIVDAELKIEVREDIKAANMTANIRPINRGKQDWAFGQMIAVGLNDYKQYFNL